MRLASIRAGVIGALVVLLCSSATPATTPASSDLCYPMLGSHDRGVWNAASGLFKSGHYVAAARGYYQVFLCGTGGGGPIFPLVRDYNQLAPFDAAMRSAAAGNFHVAIVKLKRILKVLPQFGEARFLMGVFQWSEGEHSQALQTWRDTINGSYFTLAPDAPRPPFIVTKAQEFLLWGSYQMLDENRRHGALR